MIFRRSAALLMVFVFTSSFSFCSSTQESPGKEGPLASREDFPTGFSVQGEVNAKGVLETVKNHLADVRTCYRNSLLKDEDLKGRVVMQWTINESGDVVDASVKETEGDTGQVAECFKNEILKWKFDKPHDGKEAVVTFPFSMK